MRSTTVASVDWLGEMPAQDAGAGAVLRIETSLPTGEDNAFYMDVVDPRPVAGDPITFGIEAGFLGSHHESNGVVGAFASAAMRSIGCRVANSGYRAGMRRRAPPPRRQAASKVTLPIAPPGASVALGANSVTQLRRYTNALALIDMLRRGRLTLLSPVRWNDQNDALGLAAYGNMRGEGSVYAACMAIGKETAHHWQLFAGSDHGLCIIFDKDEFSEHLEELKESVLHGPVQYRNLEQIRAMAPISQDQIPFLKRDTFKAEEEYRVVAWEDEFFAGDTYTIPLPPRLIRRVTFGPAMPESFVETLLEVSRQRDEWQHITFGKSRLFNNASWATAIKSGTRSS